MKILDVRFQNLNSLSGQWYIDFTHPDYVSNGIFAIVGPTGSGKTTILDAICLALYGRTPRLDKVTKSANEIMSRRSGECYAEATFETQKGRYRCNWRQWRARKKPDGELQPAKHEIVEADSGQVLESKIISVEELVEKVTGLDFERFTRSVLLAQGGFAAFLQASPDKRAPILEQITGTGIYSRISIKVFERSRQETQKLQDLETQLQGMKLLSEEEEIQRQAALQEKQLREKEEAEKITRERACLAWVEEIARLTGELHELNEKCGAAETRWNDFAAEAKLLAWSLKALSVQGSYQELIALHRQQNADVAAIGEAGALIPQKEEAQAMSVQSAESARLQLQKARDQQARETEVIKKTRELDARLAEKTEQINEAEKDLSKTARQAQAYQKSIVQREAAWCQAREELAKIKDYLEKQASDQALAESLAAIGKSFAVLTEAEDKEKQANEDWQSCTGQRQAAFDAQQKCLAEEQKQRRELEKTEADFQTLDKELNALLQNREISQWRDDLDAFRERKVLLLQTLDIIDNINDTEKACHLLDNSLQTWQTAWGRLATEINQTGARRSLLEKDLDNMETQVALLTRIRDLEEERRRLEEGRPCPLCGATVHPYADGQAPELNDAEKTLRKIKAELKKETEKLARLDAEKARIKADLSHGQKEKTLKIEILEEAQKCRAQLFGQLNIAGEPAEQTAKVKDALTEVEAKIPEVFRFVAMMEEKSKKEKVILALLEKARAKTRKADADLQKAVRELEKTEDEQRRLEREKIALIKKIEKMRAEVLQETLPFGIVRLDSDCRTRIFQELSQRKFFWEEQLNQKNAFEKKINDLRALLDKDLALSDNLEKDREAKTKQLQALMALRDALDLSRCELFGDKNPAAEEKRLAEAVIRAEQLWEQKRAVAGQFEKEVIELKAKIASLQLGVDRRTLELSRADMAFQNGLQKAGLENEAEFLKFRLPEEQRAKLAEKEKALSKEKTELEARKKDKAEALAAQLEKKLTSLSGVALAENLAAAEKEITQIRKDIGAIEKELTDQARLREDRAELLQKRDTQKEERVRWEALRELIGSADGKKYRNFAQGLTFEMMTAYANRQLCKMTDRYLLIRDNLTSLELNVIDHYQAGETRSTKNLSGGECFIVSLALALGLSRMAGQNVRIDSLFLDEGFGALDEETLETALDTLAELRQDGKLIGVISHVTALKERISAQIQVIPETGGRGSLSGPGCFKY